MGGRRSAPPGQSFGALLKYLRRRARLTQRDLALAVGYSPEHVCRLEQNQRTPDIATITALFVPALELENEPELVAQLLEQAAAARGESLLGRHVSAIATVQTSYTEPDEPSGTLPLPPSALIGREQELLQIAALLSGEARLVTLTGPPGVGKTRLALEIAAALRDDFPDGVFLVPLATVRSGALVLPAIAKTLGANERLAVHSTPLQEILALVRDRRILLVLDNFEQVFDAAPAVAELLAACPSLGVLVTSRSRLHVRAEHRISIAPLALPPRQETTDPERARQAPAVDLYCRRARSAEPGFELDGDNVADVVRLCHAVDGLPLAIELLAARSGAFTPAELLARIDRRLSMLTGGPRDLPPRQRALRDSIAWSHELLGRPERMLFRRLGMFAGGWTLAAAEQVCELDPAGPAVADALANLAEASLITRSAHGARYGMLETIREFAAERLADSGEVPMLRRRLLEYLLGLSSEVKQHAGDDDQLSWLARLEDETANIRAAIMSVAAERRPERQDVEAVLRLGAGLVWFWGRLDEVREGTALINAVLRVTQRAWQLGVIPSPNTPELAKMLNLIGYFALADGDFEASAQTFEQSLQIYRQLGDTRGIANVVNNLGILARDQGRYGEARALYEESLALEHELGSAWGIAMSQNNIALLALIQGQLAEARALFDAGLQGFVELGDELGVAEVLLGSARTAMIEGDIALARRQFEASLGRLRELRGERRLIHICLFGLAGVSAAEGDVAAAREQLYNCLLMLHDTPEQYAMAEVLAEVAAMLGREGRIPEAAALLAPVRAFLQRTGAMLYPDTRAAFEDTLAAIEAHGDDPAVATAAARARSWTLEHAVEHAADILAADGSQIPG